MKSFIGITGCSGSLETLLKIRKNNNFVFFLVILEIVIKLEIGLKEIILR